MNLIEVDRVVKRFRLGATQDLMHAAKRVLTQVGLAHEPSRPKLNALDDVSFNAQAGDVNTGIGRS